MAFPIIMRLKWNGKEIRSEKDRPEGLSIRVWRSVAKASYSAMAFYWHENFLPLHFGRSASRRYPGVYAPRTMQWLMRKKGISGATVNSAMNKAGKFSKFKTKEDYWREFYRTANQLIESTASGIDYNVFRGGLQDIVEGTAVVRAFPGRFSLEMQMPSYVPVRQKRRTYKGLGQLRKDFGNATMRDQPAIREELTAMLPSEMTAMQKIGQRVLTQKMQQVLSTGQIPAGATE